MYLLGNHKNKVFSAYERYNSLRNTHGKIFFVSVNVILMLFCDWFSRKNSDPLYREAWEEFFFLITSEQQFIIAEKRGPVIISQEKCPHV